MAALLRMQLARLEAMRQAADRLMARKRLGVHVFRRGMPENIRTPKDSRWQADLVDLLKAYAAQQARKDVKILKVYRRPVLSLKEARQRLERMLEGLSEGNAVRWQTLDEYLIPFLEQDLDRKTVLASSFGAVLEMAREDRLELRQSETFGPLYVRKGKTDDKDKAG